MRAAVDVVSDITSILKEGDRLNMTWLAERRGSATDVLRLADVPVGDPGDDEVIVKVEVVGLSYADLLICKGTYQYDFPLPYRPGGEVVGRVVECGAQSKSSFVGQRVLVAGGGLAEYVRVKLSSVYPIPEEMDAIKAVSLPVNYSTVVYGLERGGGFTASSVLVLGAAGGIGTAALDLLTARGRRVIAVVGGEKRAAAVQAHWPSCDLIDRMSCRDVRRRVLDLTDGEGAECCLDPVGGTTGADALRSLAFQGSHISIGFAAGTPPSLKLNHLLVKGISVHGISWGRYIMKQPDSVRPTIELLVSSLDAGILNPIGGTIAEYREVPQLVSAMELGQTIGKPVVLVARGSGGSY